MIWTYLVCSIFFYCLGEYFSKLYAIEGQLYLAITCMVCYSISGIPWLMAIRVTNTLAVTGVVWCVLSLIATVVIGLVVFGEQLNNLKMIGMGFAFVSIILLSW